MNYGNELLSPHEPMGVDGGGVATKLEKRRFSGFRFLGAPSPQETVSRKMSPGPRVSGGGGRPSRCGPRAAARRLLTGVDSERVLQWNLSDRSSGWIRSLT